MTELSPLPQLQMDAAVFAAGVGSVADARDWLESFLSGHRIPHPCIEDGVLVLSELVTNALRHGDGAAVCWVSVDDHGGRYCVGVVDSGGGRPQLLAADPDRIGGLGMVVVDQLAAAWGVNESAFGKTVWAALPSRHHA